MVGALLYFVKKFSYRISTRTKFKYYMYVHTFRSGPHVYRIELKRRKAHGSSETGLELIEKWRSPDVVRVQGRVAKGTARGLGGHDPAESVYSRVRRIISL